MRQLLGVHGVSDDDVLITLDQFKQMTGLGMTKVYEILNGGAVDAVKLGKSTKITLGSAKRFIQTLPRYSHAKSPMP